MYYIKLYYTYILLLLSGLVFLTMWNAGCREGQMRGEAQIRITDGPGEGKPGGFIRAGKKKLN